MQVKITYIHIHIVKEIICIYIHTHIHTYIHTYIHTKAFYVEVVQPSALLGGDEIRNLSAREDLLLLLPWSRDIKLVTYIHIHTYIHDLISVIWS